jgi:peptide/nickel transport system ATP-binding protein
MKVGDQIYRVLRLHQNLGRIEARVQARNMLQRVGIPESARHMQSYPHQLSGGMCQRILIAMMVACEPGLLIADEPTTGLDVTVQAQIFDLIKHVQKEQNMAMLLITHDLGVVAELCERMVVMYAGHVMEAGPVDIVFREPHHPYTKMLLQSVMRPDLKVEIKPPESGSFEENVYALTACRFALRCPDTMDICRQAKPREIVQDDEHRVMCHLYSSR